MRHRRLVAASVVLFTAIFTGMDQLRERGFAAVSMLHVVPGQPITAVTGPQPAHAANAEALRYFDVLLHSRVLLRQAVSTPFAPPRGSKRGALRLTELWSDDPAGSEASVDAAVAALQEHMHTSVDVESGTFRLEVTAPTAWLAESLSRRLLVLLQENHIRMRSALVAAQADRQRRSQVNAAAPVFIVLDAPEGSAVSTARRIPAPLVGALLGLFVGLLAAFLREFAEYQAVIAPEAYAEWKRFFRIRESK
ncbi:MAG: hypothetical protein ACT4O1_10490 [Gemmatimonadota bacterium]